MNEIILKNENGVPVVSSRDVAEKQVEIHSPNILLNLSMKIVEKCIRNFL